MPGLLMPIKGAARSGGRFRRKAEDTMLGAAMGAGRGFRYARNNAMPLVVGGSIGGGAATAYQQTRSRRSEVGKSAKDTYLISRFGKGYVSVSRGSGQMMERLARRSNALQAMKESADPQVAARGRLLSRRMTDGMTRRVNVRAGRVEPRVKKSLPSALRGSRTVLTNARSGDGYAASRVKANMAGRGAGRKMAAGDSVTSNGLVGIGRDNRLMSRLDSARAQTRRGMLSPRRAQALSLNSYRNPLSRV
jgi:hypothetical protein